MLGTLVQIAKEMLEYETKNKKISLQNVELNRLCWNPAKRGSDLKIATLLVDKAKIRLQDFKDIELYRSLFALSTGKQAIGPAWILDFSKKGKTKEQIIGNGLGQIETSLRLLAEDLSKRDSKWVEGCLATLEKRRKKLREALLAEDLPKRVLLDIEFKKRKPGDLESPRESFLKRRLLGGERAQYVGKSACAVCGNETTVRPSLPFDNFFTVEKRGFAPMGAEANSWKYAPLCEECTKWLYISQSFLNGHLKARVAGISVYLIPTLEPGSSTIKGSFIHYLWEFQERSHDRVAPRAEDLPEEPKEDHKQTDDNEPTSGSFNIMRQLLEEKTLPPFRSLALVFHQMAGQKFLFLHTTPEILPKHLREVKGRLDELRSLLIQGALGQLGESKARILTGDFNFVSYAWSWPKGRAEKKKSSGVVKLNPMLLVEAILFRRAPAESIFWSDADSILRAYYTKAISGGNEFTVKQILSNQTALIWALWNLLYQPNQGGSPMETKQSTNQTEVWRLPLDFWDKFFSAKRMLDTDSKRALFLTGVLFGRIESLQRRERETRATGEMPIIGRLRGLTISYNDMTSSLFPELKYKLRQLSGWTRAAKEIEAAAADYLSCATAISDAEARFYFSLGWSLEWHTYDAVRQSVGKEEGEEDVEEPTELETKEESKK